MIYNWYAVPALRMALAIIAGIVWARFAPGTTWITLGTLLLTGMALLLVPLSIVHRARWRGAGLMILVAGFGFGHYQLREALKNAAADREWLNAEEAPTLIWARLSAKPDPSTRWFSAEAEILSYRQLRIDEEDVNGSWQPIEPLKVQLMLGSAEEEENNAILEELSPGDFVLAEARIQKIKTALNPDAFDFSALLAEEGIFYQAWLRSEDYECFINPKAPGFLQRLRSHIASRIDQCFPSAQEAGVAKALLIGDRAGLDERTKFAYTSTGAVHVLAVSGLHTGVIAGLLVWVLKRVFRRKYIMLQMTLLVALLFGYVALTGFSPSVQRASIMFGVEFLAQLARRDANSFNTLGLSALILLLIQPQFLFQIGFQLSFMAVAGIMAFYKPIYKLLKTSWRLPNYFIELSVVSLAATLGTMPITIFYFHQFPAYFMISGLVAVPLVSFALPLLLGTLMVDGILLQAGISWSWLYLPTYGMIWLCNHFLLLLSELPGALLQALHPSAMTTLLMLGFTVMMGVCVLRRRQMPLFIALGFLLVAALSHTWSVLKRLQDDHWVLYSLPETQILDVFQSGNVYYSRNGDLSERVLKSQVWPHRSASGINPGKEKSLTPVFESEGASWFAFEGLRWAVLDTHYYHLAEQMPELDLLIVRNPAFQEPTVLAKAAPFIFEEKSAAARLVLGKRIPVWERAEWEPLLPYAHILPEQGAVTASLSKYD